MRKLTVFFAPLLLAACVDDDFEEFRDAVLEDYGVGTAATLLTGHLSQQGYEQGKPIGVTMERGVCFVNSHALFFIDAEHRHVCFETDKQGMVASLNVFRVYDRLIESESS